MPPNKRSDNKSLVYGVLVVGRNIFIFFGSVVLVSNLYSRSLYWVLLAPLILGIAAYRIQFILHDTSHFSLFNSKKTNTVVGHIAGLLVGVDFRRYRFTHTWHHRRNGEKGDPQYSDYLGDKKFNRFQFIRFLIAPLIGSRLIPYLKREMTERNVVGQPAPRTSRIWWCEFISMQTTLAVLIYTISGNLDLLILYYAGLSTTSLFLSRVRTIAEHQQVNGVATDFSRSHKWNLFDWALFYDANFNRHFEHHLYPNLQSKDLKSVTKYLLETGNSDLIVSPSVFRTLKSIYLSLPK